MTDDTDDLYVHLDSFTDVVPDKERLHLRGMAGHMCRKRGIDLDNEHDLDVAARTLAAMLDLDQAFIDRIGIPAEESLTHVVMVFAVLMADLREVVSGVAAES